MRRICATAATAGDMLPSNRDAARAQVVRPAPTAEIKARRTQRRAGRAAGPQRRRARSATPAARPRTRATPSPRALERLSRKLDSDAGGELQTPQEPLRSAFEEIGMDPHAAAEALADNMETLHDTFADRDAAAYLSGYGDAVLGADLGREGVPEGSQAVGMTLRDLMEGSSSGESDLEEAAMADTCALRASCAALRCPASSPAVVSTRRVASACWMLTMRVQEASGRQS